MVSIFSNLLLIIDLMFHSNRIFYLLIIANWKLDAEVLLYYRWKRGGLFFHARMLAGIPFRSIKQLLYPPFGIGLSNLYFPSLAAMAMPSNDLACFKEPVPCLKEITIRPFSFNSAASAIGPSATIFFSHRKKVYSFEAHNGVPSLC